MCHGYSIDIENPLWFLLTESVGQRKADAEIEKPIFRKWSSIPLPFLSSLFTSKWWLQQLTSCEIARTLTHTHLWSHLAVTHTHRADSGDWAISSSPDESFNLSVPFEDRNKLFLGLPHQDEMAIGEIMSMTQFECLRKKGPNIFKAACWNFWPGGWKGNPWNWILAVILGVLGRDEWRFCLACTWDAIALYLHEGWRREAYLPWINFWWILTAFTMGHQA